MFYIDSMQVFIPNLKRKRIFQNKCHPLIFLPTPRNYAPFTIYLGYNTMEYCTLWRVWSLNNSNPEFLLFWPNGCRCAFTCSSLLWKYKVYREVTSKSGHTRIEYVLVFSVLLCEVFRYSLCRLLVTTSIHTSSEVNTPMKLFHVCIF